MAGKHKVWISPNSDALATFKRQEKRNAKKSKTKRTPVAVKAVEADILPPGRALTQQNGRLAHLPGAPKVEEPTFTPPLDLFDLEHTIREMSATLDFDLPEGFLDTWFTKRVDHRIEVKIERMQLIAEFQRVAAQAIEHQCDMAEGVRRHNQIRCQQVIDALIAWRTAVEEHLRVQLVHERIENERRVDSARTELEIAKLEVEAKSIRGQLPLSSSELREERLADAETEAKIAAYEKQTRQARQVESPLSEAEKRERRKKAIQGEIVRLEQEEAAEIERITGGLPEDSWSDLVRDDAKRIQNLYSAAREREREKLRRVL